MEAPEFLFEELLLAQGHHERLQVGFLLVEGRPKAQLPAVLAVLRAAFKLICCLDCLLDLGCGFLLVLSDDFLKEE